MLLIPEGEPFGELAPVLDESVIGFPSDIRPARPGVKEMLEPARFELGQTGIPVPKLVVFAQSLLDTNNGVDLEDLVNGMNLSMEWGEEYLELDGSTDVAWANWKAEALEREGKSLHGWDGSPEKRREIWQSTVSADGEKWGQGWKYNAACETRFWRRGQRHPRRRKGGF
ncbi:hypothetical protein HO133_010441 [Letharia lupina]|uniref:Uncharacterized protein n=1 Tax=Letharia lupina TaxID=560253 RepID=A0A8H6FEU9_9LECA|nr:uncharacterized protein HO133_010441 [Letharia lupina]KAF6225244.1 hypothetical protein HO133_010441 [Letharia lupina]